MEYHAKTIPLANCPISSAGLIEPLCDICKVVDCTNQVEKRTVSIMGITRRWKLLIRGTDPYLVVECDGFTT